MDTDGDWHEAGDGNLGKLSDVEEDTPELLETVQEVQDLTGGNPSGNEDPAAEPGDLDSLNNDEYFRLQGIKTWPTTPPTTNRPYMPVSCTTSRHTRARCRNCKVG